MPALHIRDVPESVMTALRERAARHGRSVQQETREILESAVAAPRPQEQPVPVRLITVRTLGHSSWGREDVYGDAGR